MVAILVHKTVQLTHKLGHGISYEIWLGDGGLLNLFELADAAISTALFEYNKSKGLLILDYTLTCLF